MLLTESSKKLDNYTLAAAYENLQGDPPQAIPFLVWLLENPDSPCSLPGNISLANHDRLHSILDRGFCSESEAYIVGFSMGTDVRTNWLHIIILKVAALFFYPAKYRFKHNDVDAFDRGFQLGKSLKIKNLNRKMPSDWDSKTLRQIRAELSLEI